MAGARDGTWELTAGVGAMVAGQAIASRSGSTAFMPGGTLRVGYNLNEMWNISVGAGLGYGGDQKTAFLTPGATLTWTPDINKPTSPFLSVGAGLLYIKSPLSTSTSSSNFGVQVGAGVRHMVGENLAVRVEGGATVASVGSPSATSGAGHVTVGLSLFAGGKKILTHIAVNPGTATLASLRQTQQFSATAHDQKGREMAGKMFTWRSSNAAVATVSATGAVTAVGDGSATVSATAEGVTGSANVMVSRTAGSVTVTPATGALSALGATWQVTDAAKDAGNNALTSAFTWTSSNAQVATVSPTGLVTAVGNGTATITAATGGKTATATVTVAQAVATVNVTPATSSLTSAGATAMLTAAATDANNRPVAAKTFTWTSERPAVATVANGTVTAVADGASRITATVDGKSGSAMVTVVVPAKGAPPVELPSLPAVNATKVVALTFRVVRGAQTLTPAAQSDLDKYAIAIQGAPNAKWEIGGYTSNVGAAARNTQVSQRRADAVKAYLLSKGVAAASLTAVGYGPQRPIGNNRTAAGRAQNNRIELKRVQ